MPQGKNYWNPYRMVPIKDETPERHLPITHEQYKGLSGEVEATLTTLTPLLIGVQEASLKSQVTSRHTFLPILPGSSLKGMIRSLAEIVGNGCDVMDKHTKCTNPDKLCICCRMFGMQHNDQSFLGKVCFGGGLWQGEGRPVYMQKQQVLLSNPKERHNAFYISNKKVRKLYHHNPSCITRPQLAKSTDSEKMVADLIPLRADEVFHFKVSFSNLKNTELNLLLYCLALERDITIKVNGCQVTGTLHHKLGMGKPIGMGSVKIDLTKMMLYDADHAKRYSSWGHTEHNIKEGEMLGEEVAQRTAALRDDNSPTMNHLRSILLWLPEENRKYNYPDHDWFTSNSQIPLKNPITGE